MRNILITGASGFLGHHVVKALLSKGNFKIFAILGRPEDKANALPEDPNLEVLPCTALFTESFENIDTVVNCAFARSNDYGLLAGALEFTSRLIVKLREDNVKSVINISSQGVYKRLDAGDLASESSPIEPMDTYALGKYSTEQMFLAGNLPNVTNARMASINMPMRFLNFFVQKVKNGEPINITTPKQPAALIDVRDAAEAIAAIVALEAEKRSTTYNVGIGTQMTILDYAKEVIRVGETLGYTAPLNVEDNDKCSGAGMDCSLICKECGWKPTIKAADMIHDLFTSVG